MGERDTIDGEHVGEMCVSVIVLIIALIIVTEDVADE